MKKYLLLILFALAFSKSTQAQLSLSQQSISVCEGKPIVTHANMMVADSALYLYSTQFIQGMSVRSFNFPFIFFEDTFRYFQICKNNFVRLLNVSTSNISYNSTWWNLAIQSELNAAVMPGWQNLYYGLADALLIFQEVGQQGSRRAIFQWCNVAQESNSTAFQCSQYKVTNQVILYEGSNIIEFHTKAMPGSPNCPSYNAGGPNAVQGLRYVDSNSGNVLKEVYTPGRGINDNWGAVGDSFTSRRFTPIAAAPYYQVDTIPYHPWYIMTSVDTNLFYWYNELGTLVSQGPTLNAVASSTNPNATGTYFVVKYLGPAGCDTVSDMTDTFWVHFAENDTTINKAICEGDSYNFGNQILSSAGTYHDTFSNQYNCDSIVTLNLTINPLPNAVINASSPAHTCVGKAYALGTDSIQGYSYQWFLNGNAIAGADSSVFLAYNAGSYTLQVTSDKACSQMSAAVQLIVHPHPEVNISSNTTNICAGDTVLLTANPSDGMSYDWYPKQNFLGDTARQTFQEQAIVLQTQYLKLVMADQWGCEGSDSLMISTTACCDIYLPNAFSPNDDHINDVFMPHLGPGREVKELKVYNRWGNVVYQCYSSHCDPWRGTDFNGKPLDIGVYFYKLKYKCADGNMYNAHGEITLLR